MMGLILGLGCVIGGQRRIVVGRSAEMLGVIPEEWE